MRWVLSLSSFYKGGNRGREGLGNLPKVAQLVFSRAGIWTQAGCLQSEHSPEDWLESWLPYQCAKVLWTSDFASLCLRFLIYKMGIIKVPIL